MLKNKKKHKMNKLILSKKTHKNPKLNLNQQALVHL